MELTPELLTSTTFQDERRGGYNKEEVDDFLERLAAAVREMQERLHDAERRAADATRQLSETPNDEEIRRVLLLAQRTASAAIEEANADAVKVRDAADRHASEQMAEAERRRVALEEELARHEHEALDSLHQRRDSAQNDVDALEHLARSTREQVRAMLAGQLAVIDDLPPIGATTGETTASAPVAQESSAAQSPEEPAVEAEPEPTMAMAAVSGEASSDEAAFEQPVLEDATTADEPTVDADDEAGDEPFAEVVRLPAPVPARPPFDDAAEDDDDAFNSQVADLLSVPADGGGDPGGDERNGDDTAGIAIPADAQAAPTSAAGDPIEWRTVPIHDQPDDDPFLRELRRAVTDPEPLGPRDSFDDAGDAEADEAAEGRFFRRRSDV